MKPLAIDLFCGLGGWTEGFLAEGYNVVGFDIERHDYGTGGYPAQLILQDIRTIHGSQLLRSGRIPAVIVASPPCTEYSYMAMPWKRAKLIALALRGKGKFPEGYRGSRTLAQLNELFDACFRIQREASEAAGRHIPMIVENVKGAEPWVGKAQAHFGSYYLWGDVGQCGSRVIALPLRNGDRGISPRSRRQKFNPDGTAHPSGSWCAVADSENRGSKNNGGSWFAVAHNTESGVGQNPDGRKIAGQDWSRYAKTGEPTPYWRLQGLKTAGLLNIRDGHSHTRHLTNQAEHVKGFNGEASGRGNLGKNQFGRLAWSTSPKRRAAAAAIAKIPFPLAQYVARVFK